MQAANLHTCDGAELYVGLAHKRGEEAGTHHGFSRGNLRHLSLTITHKFISVNIFANFKIYLDIIPMEGNSWIDQEFQAINLGDIRLNKRMLKVANAILNNPSETIQTASNNWAGAKAAYRLLDNDQLDEQHILSLHQQGTIDRLKKSNSKTFLSIQDTTTLNFTHHPKKTVIGKLFKSQGFDSPLKGCLIHNTLLMTEDGEPLGLIEQHIYNHKGNQKSNKIRPITEKESFRWIESLQNTKKLCSSRNVITICDRESDIYEFFVEAQVLNSKIIVRAAKNRMLFKSKHQNPITL